MWDAKHDWLHLKMKVVHWMQVKVILMLFRNNSLIDWKANLRGWPAHSLITMLLSLLSHSCVGTARPELSKWAIISPVTIHRCHPQPPTPTPSVRFPLQREAITDCVCVVCLCVLHWAIHDSTKLESRPSPICSAPEAQTTTVSVQAEEMRIRMYLSRCIQYMCACVCVCECIPTLQSFDGRGLWRQTMPKGGEDHRGADSRLLKAQPRPFSSSTWENTCHSH